jgi:hypothetical protein
MAQRFSMAQVIVNVVRIELSQGELLAGKPVKKDAQMPAEGVPGFESFVFQVGSVALDQLVMVHGDHRVITAWAGPLRGLLHQRRSRAVFQTVWASSLTAAAFRRAV